MTGIEDLERRLALRVDRLAVLRPHGQEHELLTEVLAVLRCSVQVPAEALPVFRWLAAERVHQVAKYGPVLDAVHAGQGFGRGAWWHDQMLNRVGRAAALDPSSPVGMEALAKLAATGVGMLEAFVAAHPGVLPAAGGRPSAAGS